MIEMAIVLILFLMIIFGVLEFSLAIARSAALAEATNQGVRYAIVNDPLGTLPSCPDGDSVLTACDSGSCPDLIAGMAEIAPVINIQDDINVEVTYACPANDYVGGRNGLYLVTVTISGAKYFLTVPRILGLGVAMNLQTFKSTRLSEDLHTAISGG